MNILLTFVILAFLSIYSVVQSTILLLLPQKFRRKKDITGQKVLITGAGNGLGRQLAVKFSKCSTCLVLLDIDKKALEETAKLVKRSSRVFLYECDVANRKMVYAVAEKIKDDVGDIDILVNNAGIARIKSFIDLSDEEIVKTMEVNVFSHFWTCKAFLPSMMARNNGHIVTIASILGYSGINNLTHYCTSKFAAIAFSETLEMELKTKHLDGIKVTIVCPSLMNTPLFKGVNAPFHTPLSTEYVADRVLESVLEERETILIPNFYLYLFMFKSLVPRWLWILALKFTHHLRIFEEY